MKRRLKKYLMLFLAFTTMLLYGCQKGETQDIDDQGKYIGIDSMSIYIKGYDLGPGISKVILNLNSAVNSVEAEHVEVLTNDIERNAADVYLCDGQGEQTEQNSDHIAIELTEDKITECSPFTQGEISSIWVDSYPVKIKAEVAVDGQKCLIDEEYDCIDRRICPDVELFSYRDSFTGEYANPLTGDKESLTLNMAAYEPDSLSGEEKNPLIIWLHGASEGGENPDIAILGNKASALAQKNIQSYFSSGEEEGAYVLIVQCNTYWMDEGNGTNGAGSGESRYTEILMDTVESYLKHNPDVDSKRIYLAGCSNGGYMTVNMLINYPDYFAAAVPVCEAYSYHVLERDSEGQYIFSEGNPYQREDGVWTIEYNVPEGKKVGAMGSILTENIWMTEEKIQALKDTPIWFVASADDPIVPVDNYVLPTYKSLLQAGDTNCWLSLFSSYGHSSWTPFLNNEVTGVQDPEQILQSENGNFAINPTDEGGGVIKADEFSNVFEWLNNQATD